MFIFRPAAVLGRVAPLTIEPSEAVQATASPIVDFDNSPSTAADQLTFTVFEPEWMGDGFTAVPDPNQVVLKLYINTDRTQAELGPNGSGSTPITKSAGVWTHTQTGLANGTYYVCGTFILDGEESNESVARTFTVT